MESFSDVNNFLKQFVPGSILDGDFYNPDKMLTLLPLAGSPERSLKIIHVAGTSGKTSTSYYVAEMLRIAGAKVGLTVSPHIHEVNERVQINGQPISESDMCELFAEFVAIPGIVEQKPTYFELLVTFAFWAFAKLGCTHAVVEVGLGGLKDATNVVDVPTKIAVITDIGLDHTRILGNSMEQITAQKAGIIKQNNHVFCYLQGSIVDTIIEDTAHKQHAVLHRFSQEEISAGTAFNAELPNYQKRNWLHAKQVADYVIDRDNLHRLNDDQYVQSQSTIVPARMQVMQVKDKTLILDGAHNPQKLTALVASLQALYPDRSFSVMVSFSEPKIEALQDNLAIIKQLTDTIIVTGFSLQEDFAHTSVASDLIEQAAQHLHLKSIVQTDPHKALDLLLQQDSDILLITGSFYLIASLADSL